MGDSELEEGEMNCSANEDVVDLDVDLSYIDKKVQNVLGHFQENGGLGMFGPGIYDYGSFLPTYKRSPAVQPCQRSSIGNHAVQRFSNNLPVKNVVQKFQSLPTTSCKSASNHDSQTNQTSGSLLPQAPGKVPVKKEDARIPGNDLSDHKPIRVRIKMGSAVLSQKVTMVCNDLGLDDSSNSPTRNSHDDSSRMLPQTSLEKTSESPSRILQEMTTVAVPGDLLMSPLPESLILREDKEKRYTLLGNEPVLKAGKEPSIETQNKFPDVLGCGETLIGRRRKSVGCFDATTWNETPPIGEVKKQKVSSTGPLARDSSTCGLGGAGSTNDGLTTKMKLQKGIGKDGEGDPRLAFAKLNKMKAVGKHVEKEKKTCPIKFKLNSSKNSFGDKVLAKMPSKDGAYISKNSMDIGLDFVLAPSTSLDVDNWAQCDSCEAWRLLPFSLEPEQLHGKWLCSMQTWLPGMNHCGVSEEETTNAFKSFHGTDAHGPETSNAAKSYQPLTSGSLPHPIEKKPIVKDSSQGVSSNILVDAAKPMRSNSHVVKIKNIKRPLKTHNASQMSTDLGVSQNFVQDKIDQKGKERSAGTGSQIKIKKEKEGDNQESESSKQIKIGDGNKLSRDIKAEEIHCKQDLDCTPAERKKKRYRNDFDTSDVERATKKRLLASKKKPDHNPQPTAGSGSSCTKAHGMISTPVRKIRLMGYNQCNNGNSSKMSADGVEKVPSMEKAIATKVSVQESKAHQRNDLFKADGYREHHNADGSGQISGVETRSPSKILGSRKSGKKYVEEVKASPAESVSSSPARSLCPKNIALAGESIPKFGDAGNRIVNNRKNLSQEADCVFLSTTNPRNRNQPKPEVCKQNSEFGDLPCTSMKSVLENRDMVKNFSAITHKTMDRSSQTANDVLQEAEKLNKLADCFKISGFDYEYNETNFNAALKFLLGASLLEMSSTEKVDDGKMSHIEAYRTAAKLSESCAHQYETSQEMSAAALAYKCMEVACMRVVYCKSLGLSGEWNEMHKTVQMTPQGESPSSSASDVDNFCHHGVIDKSAKTKRSLSHVPGNLLPVARSQQNFVPLLEFTESMNLAMDASAKSQNAFRAVTAVTSEEEKQQHNDSVSPIKRVMDFSFHDVEALIQMIELARKRPKC